jgi:hypothetical protein
MDITWTRPFLQKIGGFISLSCTVPIFTCLLFTVLLHLNLTPYVLKKAAPNFQNNGSKTRFDETENSVNGQGLSKKLLPANDSIELTLFPSNHRNQTDSVSQSSKLASENSKEIRPRLETRSPAIQRDGEVAESKDNFFEQLLRCKVSKGWMLTQILPLVILASLISVVCDSVAKLTPSYAISDSFCDFWGKMQLEFYGISKILTYEFFLLKVLLVRSLDTLKNSRKRSIKIGISLLSCVFAFYLIAIPITWQGFVGDGNVCGFVFAHVGFFQFILYSWPALDFLVSVPLLYAFISPLIRSDKAFQSGRYKELVEMNVKAAIISLVSNQIIMITIIVTSQNLLINRVTTSLTSIELAINSICILYTMKRSWVKKKSKIPLGIQPYNNEESRHHSRMLIVSSSFIEQP